MPPPPRMVTVWSYRLVPAGIPHDLASIRAREVAEPGQRQGERMLGHRLGVGTLGARPDPGVVEQPGLGHPLHAGERELHPPGVRHLPSHPASPPRPTGRATPRLSAGRPGRATSCPRRRAQRRWRTRTGGPTATRGWS